jgi:hypothetical protein
LKEKAVKRMLRFQLDIVVFQFAIATDVEESVFTGNSLVYHHCLENAAHAHEEGSAAETVSRTIKLFAVLRT